MEKNQLYQIVSETYLFLNNKNIGFICYVWDKDGKLGGGCQSADAELGDAMVTIFGITKHFNIDIDRLCVAFKEYEEKKK